jgi:transcriptional regulator with XRE-family HTH domain
MMSDSSKDLGKTIRQQRVMSKLKLRELARISGVSASHLGRIERGERFPTARILNRIAKPLGFGESKLLTMAGYLSCCVVYITTALQ